MSRLFITLYLVVLSSFVLLLFFINGITLLGEVLPGSRDIEERITKGSFMLLDRSIDGLDQQQTTDLVEQYQKKFGQYFDLIELQKLPLEEDEIERLQKGEIVESTEEDEIVEIEVEYIKSTDNEPQEPDFIYKKVANSNWVWRINLDTDVDYTINNFTLHTTVNPGRYTNGMMYLIESYLIKHTEDQWLQKINELKPDFGILVSLSEKTDLLASLEGKQGWHSRVIGGDVVNITQESDYATFVKIIPDSSKVIQIGPIEIPWVHKYLIHLLILSFVLAFAITLFLWARPLWSSLIKIKQAADEFGSGNYSARVPYKKRSPIATISKAFNAMAERTQRSIRSHKELTSAVSHELRTPVARMRFALEMLSATNDENDKQRFVNDINKDIDELDLLLEELLTYARFDQDDSTLKLSEEKLIPWINASMNKLMPLAKGTEKILNYQVQGIGVSETAKLEARLMSRVLDNLVQNALRYSHQRVEVTLAKDNDDYLLIVEDDGEGIPKMERDHIFDAFSRLDVSRDRASGGFGLGLAIAERIVKGHQGRISIHDSELVDESGARFEVRFPA